VDIVHGKYKIQRHVDDDWNKLEGRTGGRRMNVPYYNGD
jgi:hypothetical protein